MHELTGNAIDAMLVQQHGLTLCSTWCRPYKYSRCARYFNHAVQICSGTTSCNQISERDVIIFNGCRPCEMVHMALMMNICATSFSTSTLPTDLSQPAATSHSSSHTHTNHSSSNHHHHVCIHLTTLPPRLGKGSPHHQQQQQRLLMANPRR